MYGMQVMDMCMLWHEAGGWMKGTKGVAEV